MKKLIYSLVLLVLFAAGYYVYSSKKPAVSVQQAAASPNLTSSVSIYLAALEGSGGTGPVIGCGDRLVEVKRPIEPTSAPLTAAIEELLSIKERSFGESKLYNVFYQSQLQLESARVVNETAVIYLSGNLKLGGICDSPRVAEQLRATAMQFPTVKAVTIYLNSKPLADFLTEK